MCVYTGRCVLQIRFIYKCDGLSTYPAPFQHLMDPSNVFDEVFILLCVLQNVQQGTLFEGKYCPCQRTSTIEIN
jgi:hypothetical protein